MNRKIGKSLTAVLLVAVTIASLGQSAHAQTIGTLYDKASYVPGDSGTLTVSVVNDMSTPIELRNVTIFFPWAELVNGKWPSSGANVSVNLGPSFVELGSVSSTTNIYTTTQSFTIPNWYGGASTGLPCPGATRTRYGEYSGCVLVGISGSQYQGRDLGIIMAFAAYTPTSLYTQWLPIATLVVLIVLTALFAMTWMSTRRMAKK